MTVLPKATHSVFSGLSSGMSLLHLLHCHADYLPLCYLGSHKINYSYINLQAKFIETRWKFGSLSLLREHSFLGRLLLITDYANFFAFMIYICC